MQSTGSLEVRSPALSRERLEFIGPLGRGGATELREPRLRSSEGGHLSTNQAPGREDAPNCSSQLVLLRVKVAGNA